MTVVESPALKPATTQRIDRLRLWHVPLTSHTAYFMADGKTCDTVETEVIALDTDAGLTGWGEVCPIPHYLPAYARGVAPALQELAPVILGGDPVGAEALMAKVDAFLPGHVYAKSALDMALWDITGQTAGQPVHALMGGRRQEKLPLYHSITCVEPDEMARIAREAQSQGITQFQAKLGASGDWQTDVERLAKVREALGPGPLVYGDWNCGATTLDAIRVGRGAAYLNVMLKAPCATLEDCARVQSATGLPMKMDELAHDTASLLHAHRLGIMDAVALKLSKFGGLSATRRARDLCLHLGAKIEHRMHLGQRYRDRRRPASGGGNTTVLGSERVRSIELRQPASRTGCPNAIGWPHSATGWPWPWHHCRSRPPRYARPDTGLRT